MQLPDMDVQPDKVRTDTQLSREPPSDVTAAPHVRAGQQLRMMHEAAAARPGLCFYTLFINCPGESLHEPPSHNFKGR